MAYPNDMFEGFSAEETEELQSILGDIAKKESGFYEPPDPTKIDNAEDQLRTMYENGQITAKQFEKARDRLDDLRYKIDKTKDKPINYDDIAEYSRLRNALSHYLEIYNTFRPHQALKQATPMAYYQQLKSQA